MYVRKFWVGIMGWPKGKPRGKKARVVVPLNKHPFENNSGADAGFLTQEQQDKRDGLVEVPRPLPTKQDAENKALFGHLDKSDSSPDVKVEGTAILPPAPPQPKRPTLTFDLSPRQGEALNAKEKFVLYGGAKGGGKSWFLCIWVFLKAVQNKRNKVFFCRRRAVDFNNTTLETWKKAIPPHLYRINEQKKKIFIPMSGSTIDYGGLDDPLLVQALNSAEYGHIGGDQAEVAAVGIERGVHRPVVLAWVT